VTAPFIPPDPDHLVRRYLAGEAPQKLADELGVSRTPVLRLVVAAGVQLRGRSEAEHLKWQRLRAAGREAVERQCRAAWATARGRQANPGERERAAQTRMERGACRGRWEGAFAAAFRAAGLSVVEQQAEGPYNLDLALNPLGVAVEVFGSHPHPTRDARERLARKVERLLDRGWGVVLIRCWYARGWEVRPGAVAEKLPPLLERASRDEALRGRYGVIRGDGEAAAFPRLDFDHRPTIPGLECANHGP
jgi:very-short-patch-repair endonuclease